MKPGIALQDPDRITWRDGQLLTSRDLRDDQHNGDVLRELHIRYLHKTWGVVEGLDVLAAGPALTVTPGYALDRQGHELLLPVATFVHAPTQMSAATTMYLTISNASGTKAGCTTIDLATLCPGVRYADPIEAGSLSWKTVKEVSPGHDVLLARVLVSNGAFASPPDTSIQRRAASLASTRTWSDATQAGQTGWTTPAQFTTEHSLSPFAFIQTTVDTSAAGFISRPAYFARVTGAPATSSGFITASAADSFTFALRITTKDNPKYTAASAESAGVAIEWLAVELMKGSSK